MSRKKITNKKTRVKKKTVTKKVKREVKATPEVLSFEENMKVEREKSLAMWAGVIFFMVVIMSFWVVNFKSNFVTISNDSSAGNQELKDIFSDFNEIISETKDDFDNLKNNIDEEVEEQNTKLELDNLKQKVEEMEKQIKLEKLLYQISDGLSIDDVE